MKKQFALFLVFALMLAGAAFAAPAVQMDQDLAYAPATGPPVMVFATTTEMVPSVPIGVVGSIDIEPTSEQAFVSQAPDVIGFADGVSSDSYVNTTVAVGIDRNDRRGVTTGMRMFPEVERIESPFTDLRGTKRPAATFAQLTS